MTSGAKLMKREQSQETLFPSPSPDYWMRGPPLAPRAAISLTFLAFLASLRHTGVLDNITPQDWPLKAHSWEPVVRAPLHSKRQRLEQASLLGRRNRHLCPLSLLTLSLRARGWGKEVAFVGMAVFIKRAL